MTERYSALCAHYGMVAPRNNRGRLTRTERSKARMATSGAISPMRSRCAA